MKSSLISDVAYVIRTLPMALVCCGFIVLLNRAEKKAKAAKQAAG